MQAGTFYSRFLIVVAVALSCAAAAPCLAQTNPASAAAMAEYGKKLAIYNREFGAFDALAQAYWTSITEKRRKRNAKRRAKEEIVLDDYVLTQPPRYSGPPKPVDPSQDKPPSARRPIPVVADFVRNAQEQFDFVPQRPVSEILYKRTYAKVAAAAGLSKEQAVRVYSFESGGNGRYDVQAGLEYDRPNARAISTALGYNQLLHTNSVEVLAEQGDDFVKALQKTAAAVTGQEHQRMESKIAILQRMKGFRRVLTAAELEMMNLTGDGNGFDMVTMPDEMRDKVPTSNFFQRGGYERNPVAIRNNTVKALLAATDSKMDGETKLQGAKDLAEAFNQ